MMSKDAKSLNVWGLADELVVKIYVVTKTFPKEEQYGLTSQMRRAAVSVPANITEGASRRSQQEFLQFLSIGSASLAELGYYLHLVKRLGYLGDSVGNSIASLQQQTARMLQSLINKVARDLNPNRR
jgi:four helix bundle protein